MVRKKKHSQRGSLTTGTWTDGDVPEIVPSISSRFQSPGLLLLGSLSALFAFLGSSFCTVKQFFESKYRNSLVLGIPYQSGMGYWPETVSESVSDRDSAAGKIFFTFCLIAGISLFMSWYPFNLRNVYTGSMTSPLGSLYWVTFRQYVPVVGLFMLIGVSVYPSQIALETNGGIICLCIHLVGASMMFVGYMVAEFACLEMFGFQIPRKVRERYLDIEGFEKYLRWYFVLLMFLAYIVFCVFEVLMVVVNPCCADEWQSEGTWYNRTTEDGLVSWHILSAATVSNTASGWYFWFKVGAYSGECVAGVFLILSHLTIWYYCEERHVKWGRSALEMVYNQHPDEYVDDESDGDSSEEDEYLTCSCSKAE